jgi:hypothetical protein
MIFKIDQADVRILQTCAMWESAPRLKVGNLMLEPGIRRNTEDSNRLCDMNVALVTHDLAGGWNDTDLDDYGTWEEFRKGVTLTDDGVAVVDFYIRPKNGAGSGDDLHGNIQMIVERGEMVRVEAQDRLCWSREGGYP